MKETNNNAKKLFYIDIGEIHPKYLLSITDMMAEFQNTESKC